MFENKKTILFFAENKIKAGNVILSSKIKLRDYVEFDWTYETLTQTLKNVRKNYGSEIRILLSDELVYTFALTIPADAANEKEAVKKKAQEIIPENLSETVWDYKEVFLTKKTNGSESKIVQVVAGVKNFFENLNHSLKETDFQVATVEPVSSALSRLTAKLKEPQIIIYAAKKTLLLTAFKGLVVTSLLIEDKLDPEKINETSDFVKKHFNLTVSKFILSGETNLVNVDEFTKGAIKLEIQDLNPLAGIALKKDIKGRDHDVLNLDISKALEPQPIEKADKQPPIEKPPIPEKKAPYKSIIIVILIILIIAPIGSTFYYLKFIKSKNKTLDNPAPTQSPKITTSSSPIPSKSVNAEYKIKILNGSGKEGEATKLSNLLKEKGYIIVETANADSYDYKKTIVQSKENIEESFRQNLDKILENNYSVTDGDKLSETDDADIVITVGLE